MQTVRTWIHTLASLIVVWLLCSQGSTLAQQNTAGPGFEAGQVTYQITPLPPVDEVFSAAEMPVAGGPLLGPADPGGPAAEEVKPPEADDEAEKPGEKENQDEIDSELEILEEEQSLWYFWRLWEVGYELGVNGSMGNSDTHTWRTAVRSKRATDASVLTSTIDYKKSLEQSTTTAERLYSEWRAEFPNKDSKWSWYVHGTFEYDPFRAYDARVTEDNGIGYQWYKNDVGSFITRAGAGTSREINGPEDEWIPEGVLSAVYERQLTKRQKLAFSNEFYFDWTQFGENRLNTKGDWEVILDEEAHLSLKFSVINRYDSTPEGKKPYDLDYSTVLLWSF